MTFKMKQVPEDKGRGWTLTIDGVEMVVGKVELRSRFGVLTYGLRPEGFDGWVFREEAGGGAVTVLYSFSPEGDLLVGLILEKRANMGDEPVWCIIGGFVEPDETHSAGQRREAAEESSFDTSKAMQLPAGMCVNANRAFFVANAAGGEGVHTYSLSVPFDWLEQDGESYKLKDSVMLSSGLKKPNDVRFVPWREAIGRSPDALALSAIAQLLASVL